MGFRIRKVYQVLTLVSRVGGLKTRTNFTCETRAGGSLRIRVGLTGFDTDLIRDLKEKALRAQAP